MRTHTFTEPRCPLHAVMIAMSDDDYDPFGDFDDEDDDDTFDCMMDQNGFCGKAGSEECEFDCPTMAAWRRGEIA